MDVSGTQRCLGWSHNFGLRELKLCVCKRLLETVQWEQLRGLQDWQANFRRQGEVPENQIRFTVSLDQICSNLYDLDVTLDKSRMSLEAHKSMSLRMTLDTGLFAAGYNLDFEIYGYLATSWVMQFWPKSLTLGHIRWGTPICELTI